jgi:anti-sigma regulatory factor (Ser/Thr protein kinase)
MMRTDQMTQPGISLPWTLQGYMEVPAVPAAVTSARLHTRRTLAEWELDGQADAAELVVSELVTNAVRASLVLFPVESDRWPVVRLWLSSDGDRVFIQVWDGSEARPVLRDADPRSVGGRGLVLVDSVSEGWGTYYPVQSPGKVVWVLVAEVPE